MNTTAHARPTNLSKADSQHQQLVTQTRKWVAQTFYGTVLKQMRNSPFKDKMFSGGRGGEAFGTMLDQKMAEQMSKSSGSKLVNSIVKKIESGQARSVRKPSMKPSRPAVVAPESLNLRA